MLHDSIRGECTLFLHTWGGQACPLLDVRLLLPFSTAPNPLHFDIVLSQFPDVEFARSLAVQLNPSYRNDILLTSLGKHCSRPILPIGQLSVTSLNTIRPSDKGCENTTVGYIRVDC